MSKYGTGVSNQTKQSQIKATVQHVQVKRNKDQNIYQLASRTIVRRKERKSRLKPQPKLPPLPFLAHLVQKPRDGVLLDEPGGIEMLADGEGELVFADAVLAGDFAGFAGVAVTVMICRGRGGRG